VPIRRADAGQTVRRKPGFFFVLKLAGLAFLVIGFASCVFAMAQYG
jgi:hypothetical protein